MKKTKKDKKYYSEGYKPNKNAIPVIYKGTKYLSKAQCMALEGITRRELDAYLEGIEDEPEIPKDKSETSQDDYFDVEDEF